VSIYDDAARADLAARGISAYSECGTRAAKAVIEQNAVSHQKEIAHFHAMLELESKDSIVRGSNSSVVDADRRKARQAYAAAYRNTTGLPMPYPYTVERRSGIKEPWLPCQFAATLREARGYVREYDHYIAIERIDSKTMLRIVETESGQVVWNRKLDSFLARLGF
jgi:hypothetical protein